MNAHVSLPAFQLRPARVLIGEYTPIVRGPNLDPIPPGERVPIPVYAYDHETVDRDCEGDARWPGADLTAVEARRARLHAALDADATSLRSDHERALA